MSYKRRITARGVIIKDDKLLLQKLKKPDGEADYWCTPGGGMDDGESVEQCLVREMIEETGVKPVLGELLFIQQFHDGKREQLEFFYHIQNTADYLAIDLHQTTHGGAEVSRIEFIDPKNERVLPEFLQTIDIKKYVTERNPALLFDYM